MKQMSSSSRSYGHSLGRLMINFSKTYRVNYYLYAFFSFNKKPKLDGIKILLCIS